MEPGAALDGASLEGGGTLAAGGSSGSESESLELELEERGLPRESTYWLPGPRPLVLAGLDLLECMGLRLSTRCGGWAGDRRFPWGDIHTDQTSSKIR